MNEISIKTRNIHHNDIPLSAIKLKLCVSSNKLLDWKEYLKSDLIKTIKMFFNCQYNTKENVKSPYTSNKNDNVKFLLMYLYNIDNPNYNVSGNIHILNMKKMFNLLSCYMDENLVQIQHNQSSLDIMVNDELVFRIRNAPASQKYNTIIDFYLRLDNPNSFFTQLINFTMPLHLDRECWISDKCA